MNSVVISSAARTPIGSFQGSLSRFKATHLGAFAIGAAVETAEISPESVGELIMGCVLPAGQGQAPARQAGITAGLPEKVPATTVNKMCGSGMKSVMLAHDRLALGDADLIIAGGMESMSNAPYLLPNMRKGARIGHREAVDHMFVDGLEDAYEQGKLMGEFAEDCAQAYQFTRNEQDTFAITSLARARTAEKEGRFAAEIKPISTQDRNDSREIGLDEQPTRACPDRIASLRPAFRSNGTVTAANSSSISDGAAAILLSSEKAARKHGLPIRAKVAGHSTFAQSPKLFTTAPVFAVQDLLEKVSWRAEDIDLWEINEAFAVVPMAFMRETNVPHERLNVYGGACAIGHPIGASGARIIVTLLNAMEQCNAKRGIAAICIGGGEATAVAIERQ